MNPNMNNNYNQGNNPTQPNAKPNYAYGVDTNDKEAMKAEYYRLKKQHRIVTIVSVLVIGILLFFGFDFFRTNMMNQKPIIAYKEKVDFGYLYHGIGYKILYCDDGTVYKGVIEKNKCNELDNSTFDKFFYNAFMDYAKTSKIVDAKNLEKLEIIKREFDENNSRGGSDYLVDIKYSCFDGGSSCFKTLKEKNDQNNIRVYVSLDSNNKVFDIVSFKDSGIYYDLIRGQFEEKVKQYKIDNGLLDEERLRSFKVKLLSNYGRYKYQDVMYADTYKIAIYYLCNDDTNTCVTGESVDQENYYFEEIMLLDEEDNIALLKNPRIID